MKSKTKRISKLTLKIYERIQVIILVYSFFCVPSRDLLDEARCFFLNLLWTTEFFQGDSVPHKYGTLWS